MSILGDKLGDVSECMQKPIESACLSGMTKHVLDHTMLNVSMYHENHIGMKLAMKVC